VEVGVGACLIGTMRMCSVYVIALCSVYLIVTS
jgi:hypothetical protein